MSSSRRLVDCPVVCVTSYNKACRLFVKVRVSKIIEQEVWQTKLLLDGLTTDGPGILTRLTQLATRRSRSLLSELHWWLWTSLCEVHGTEWSTKVTKSKLNSSFLVRSCSDYKFETVPFTLWTSNNELLWWLSWQINQVIQEPQRWMMKGALSKGFSKGTSNRLETFNSPAIWLSGQLAQVAWAIVLNQDSW